MITCVKSASAIPHSVVHTVHADVEHRQLQHSFLIPQQPLQTTPPTHRVSPSQSLAIHHHQPLYSPPPHLKMIDSQLNPFSAAWPSSPSSPSPPSADESVAGEDNAHAADDDEDDDDDDGSRPCISEIMEGWICRTSKRLQYTYERAMAGGIACCINSYFVRPLTVYSRENEALLLCPTRAI